MTHDRRDFLLNLLGLGAATASGAVGVGLFNQPANAHAPIRPPEALPEADFLSTCIRCQCCADACPNHCIKASFGAFEGIERITAGRLRDDWQLPIRGEIPSRHARQSVGEFGSSLIPPRSGERGYAARPSRLNVLDSRLIRWLVTSRPFRFALQLIVVSLFFLVIAAGLFGNQNPAMNIAPILTWTVWWGGLVILIMFAGKAWCFICPWDAVAGWMEKLRF